MKKLILIIALLTISLYPQSKLLLLMGGEGYKNAETKTYLASLTTPISSTYAKTLDTFISMVKDSLAIANLSDAFDVMYDLGGETTEQSLKNLVKRQHDATAVNSPTWTQWEGFTGNGTSSYLNTNYNPATQGVVYVQNSASLGVYIRTNVDEAGVDIGAQTEGYTTGIYISTRRYDTKFYWQINENTNSQFVNGVSWDSRGFTVAVRPNSTQVYGYKNGVNYGGAKSANSIGTPNLNIYILCGSYGQVPTTFSTKQTSFAFLGKSLSATEVRKLTNCVEWLMDSKGKGVIP